MKLAFSISIENFSDIIGQPELTGEGTALQSIISSGSFDSLIFVGPPGSGKTSMAVLIGNKLDTELISLHSTTSGVAELKRITDSLTTKGNIIFIDEIHRYSKIQQDFLLKLIDDRTIKLIGASTENPYFKLTPALRSRSFIFKFKPLDAIALALLSDRALPVLCKLMDIKHIDYNNQLNKLIDLANGDGRRFLNLLELSAMIGNREGETLFLASESVEELLSNRRYNDDENCDLFSAMIKSIRGSDPDAALLWAMKLFNQGVAAEAIYRRLMVSASEDIGNAYPEAVSFINSSYNNFMNVGLPEGGIILSHAVVYLASLPKSNRSYLAYNKMLKYLEDRDPIVPNSIKFNTKTYKYPFDYGEFVEQQYLATNIDQQFYYPSAIGFESKISDRLNRLWKVKNRYMSDG